MKTIKKEEDRYGKTVLKGQFTQKFLMLIHRTFLELHSETELSL